MPSRKRNSVEPDRDVKSGAVAKDIAMIEAWFSSRGWRPFEFQRDAWNARLRGESGLIHVPTGAGKTYAAFLGALLYSANAPGKGLRVLYLTPLKAVARDVQLALEAAVRGLAISFGVEARTGDTASHTRAKQKKAMPEVLVTTPESLALLISDPECARHFNGLDTVVLDEWHECIGNKRGSLLELTLTRLRSLRPALSTWALTATLANAEEAAAVAVGTRSGAAITQRPTVIRARLDRPIAINSLIPPQIDSFPWAGHLGLRLAEPLAEWLDPERPTLIFTNTRGQAERWFQALSLARPEWKKILALHHGSLDRKERERVEAGIKQGELRFVVATSTLDLGVDFAPVDRVVQVGSPKGIARLLQRAGRSAHRPGESAQVHFVPTHALELIEINAARRAIRGNQVEPRRPIDSPLDVLVQHLVTRALGGGFTRDEIAAEVRSAFSFAGITDADLEWALKFVLDGGFSLQAYPSFRRVELDYGVYRVRSPGIARLHRMNIGTIVSEAGVALKFVRGKQIGFIDEGFVSKLKKGDRFLFSGKILEYVGMQNLEARVRLARGAATVSPSWHGGRLPYSSSLSGAVRDLLDQVRTETADLHEGPESLRELAALEPIFAAQRRISTFPSADQTLIEVAKTREGAHCFIFPFEGRLLHEGIAAILALRLSRREAATFSLAANDYGFEILSAGPFAFEGHLNQELFNPDGAVDDLRAALDLTQTARQRFREIARVAGLLHPGHPSARKNVRQLQVSAGLLFDVFRRYEPDHPLIRQTQQQVLDEQMEGGRLISVLSRISRTALELRPVTRPTPLGFPLVAERMGARLSSESLEQRIERLKHSWREK